MNGNLGCIASNLKAGLSLLQCAHHKPILIIGALPKNIVYLLAISQSMNSTTHAGSILRSLCRLVIIAYRSINSLLQQT